MATELPGDYYDQVNSHRLTGKRMHWVDVHFLHSIQKDLEARGIHHARDLRRLTDRDLVAIAGESPRLRINLWHARGLGPEEPELMSDDEDPDFPVIRYLNRLE